MKRHQKAFCSRSDQAAGGRNLTGGCRIRKFLKSSKVLAGDLRKKVYILAEQRSMLDLDEITEESRKEKEFK